MRVREFLRLRRIALSESILNDEIMDEVGDEHLLGLGVLSKVLERG